MNPNVWIIACVVVMVILEVALIAQIRMQRRTYNKIRGLHQPTGTGLRWCSTCKDTTWPCPTVEALS